jgi:hypothetical protein
MTYGTKTLGLKASVCALPRRGQVVIWIDLIAGDNVSPVGVRIYEYEF